MESDKETRVKTSTEWRESKNTAICVCLWLFVLCFSEIHRQHVQSEAQPVPTGHWRWLSPVTLQISAGIKMDAKFW